MTTTETVTANLQQPITAQDPTANLPEGQEGTGETPQSGALFGTGQVDQLDNYTTPERRRVCATYCPICVGWVEVRLSPVRLRCTRYGVEARP